DVRDTGTVNMHDQEIWQECHHFCPANGAAQLTVTGDDATVECGGAYEDAGATGIDVCDGDVTTSIEVDDEVDPGTVGDYTVGYTLTTASSFPASASRNVHVVDTTRPAVATRELWVPADLRLHQYTLAECVTATDACAGVLDVNSAGRVVRITASRPFPL